MAFYAPCMLWHAQLAEAVPEAGRVGSLLRISLHDDVLPGEPTDFPVCACFPIFGVEVYGNPTPWRLISQWKRWNPAVPEDAPEAGSGRMPLDSSNRRKLPQNPGVHRLTADSQEISRANHGNPHGYGLLWRKARIRRHGRPVVRSRLGSAVFHARG